MNTLSKIGLFLLSLVLGILTIPIGMIINLFLLFVKANIKEWWNRLGDYFLIFAIAIDVTGNVALAPILNKLFIKKEGYKFGNRKETISSALGKNKELGTLNKYGIWISDILDALDPNHVLKSIDNKV